MEFECRPCNWQEEGMEELRHSLVYTNLELENTVLSAREEITRREYELVRLEFLLNKTMKERDEAEEQCQKLMLEKLVLHQQLQEKQQQKQKQEVQPNQVDGPPLSATYSSEDESSRDAMTTSLAADPSHQLPIPKEALGLLEGKSLPDKGKLLRAVMEAGPLLQTLLLAGPLPQWQHPPPPLNATEIPPVTISSPTSGLIHQDSFNGTSNATFLSKKRALEDPEYSSLNNKYQKIVISPMTNP
ncbi:uncharacterized protein LOC119989090 [Tripterygium wilfordii]|nr:uncharacterized protein LOC119989090 [Tripterygium wilfordii]